MAFQYENRQRARGRIVRRRRLGGAEIAHQGERRAAARIRRRAASEVLGVNTSGAASFDHFRAMICSPNAARVAGN